MSERRYGDDELAEILREAAQLQVDGGSSALAQTQGEGMSAAQLREVAAEAGIDPRFVDAALARREVEVPEFVEAGAVPVIGGATRYRLDATLEGGLDGDRRAAIVTAIRRAAEHQGRVHDTSLGTEWHSIGEVTQLAVNLVPRGSDTAVEIIAERGSAAALTLLMSLMPWLVLTVAIGAAFGTTLATGLGIAAMGLLGWLVSAGVIWRRSSRNWRARVERIGDAVLRAGGPRSDQPALDAPSDDPDVA